MFQSDHPLIHPWIPLLKTQKKSLINYICNKRRKKRGPKFINDLITGYSSIFFFFFQRTLHCIACYIFLKTRFYCA